MNHQLATDLKNAGINAAIIHADHVHEDWSETAYELLKQFIRSGRGKFMCEDVRSYAKAYGLPEAPHNRAWGAVIQRASRKEKIIVHAGYAQVKNPKAHCANASLWMAA